jgi:hypothetical protein
VTSNDPSSCSITHPYQNPRTARRSQARRIGSPAKPRAARRSWPRWSSTLLDDLIRPL